MKRGFEPARTVHAIRAPVMLNEIQSIKGKSRCVMALSNPQYW